MAEAVSIAPAAARAMLAVTAFGDVAPVCDGLARVLGVAAPDGPRFAREGDVFLLRLAPTRFFVMAPDGNSLVERVSAALGGVASVTDQSDAWGVFAVSGAPAHEVLARVVPVDLTPRRFGPSSVALTRAGAMDVRLWKLYDAAFEIAVGRSMGADLEHALYTAARAFS
jgi:sarcosine oxidase subunit gamma